MTSCARPARLKCPKSVLPVKFKLTRLEGWLGRCLWRVDYLPPFKGNRLASEVEASLWKRLKRAQADLRRLACARKACVHRYK